MDSEEEDFVFYGTPIEREEDGASRKKKAVAEASAQLRTLPAWKQEVRDEEGRRRFHGAFTGGFSAGYYNTVGSKDGWTPQTFVSSRKNRAEVKQQNIMNFLDEDERDELQGQSLGTSSQFDTFGFTVAEVARKQAEKEQKERPSAIPGLVPDEIILPATESIGVKLLLKMGWRRGRSIKDSHVNSVSDARREARKAFIALSSDAAKSQAPEDHIQEDFNKHVEQPPIHGVQSFQGTPVYPLTPKQDLHGLGFDPYKNAPEFRERKRSRVSGNRDPEHRNALSSKSNFFGHKGKVAPGFGIGALEEHDAEDEDVFTSEYDFEESYVQEIDEPSASAKVVDSEQKLLTYDRSVLPGFRLASNAEYQPERFDPPLVPKDFVPYHKFRGSLETEVKIADVGPPEVSPPTDNNLKVLIDGVAALVARCGKLFEDLSREKNRENPSFNFLAGGNGEDYYARKLWEARQKQASKSKPELRGKTEKLTAESRGKILGERPLEKTSKDESTSKPSDSIQLQYNLNDTFTKPATLEKLPESVKPFKDDPAKQERFEQFLKQKYEGGLRTIGFGGASYMSEDARARERLDFEAATEALEKGNVGKEIKNPTITDYLASGGLRFSSGGLLKAEDAHVDDLLIKKMYPKREEFQWRPSPILCKRFDLIDPYLGKPPPAPRMRSKIDNLIFTAEFVKGNGKEESVTKDRAPITKPQSETRRELEEVEAVVEPENVERPVDLYKAIFSDDSDDEDDATAVNKVDYPEKKVEVVNTTLSRLVAGDFLESLGKELGIELPPELPYSASGKEIKNKPQNNPILPSGDKPPSTANLYDDSSAKSGGKHAEARNDRQTSGKTSQRSSSSDSLSEYEKHGRHSRRRRRRADDSDSDSSVDDRSREKRKKSSGDKSSRKHRKHREHKHRERRSSEKERSESRRDKRRRG